MQCGVNKNRKEKDKARQDKASQDKSRLGMQCGVGYAVRGKKNRKEKDLITYVDKPSTKTQGQRREG